MLQPLKVNWQTGLEVRWHGSLDEVDGVGSVDDGDRGGHDLSG